jgi:serine/threonine protein kinase
MNDDDAVGRFVLEVRLLAEELDHPNVMPVIASRLEGDRLWFIMPRAETNLADELDAGHAGEREWVTDVFEAILEGMSHAHERDVLHRDLKPPNVLFCGGTVKVSDFGLGKRLDPDATKRTKSATWMGTEPYMAPEQFADAKRAGKPADVYALGKMLWEMLAGREPDVLHVELNAVPGDFRYFIDKCTRRDPDERFAHAGEALVSFRLLVTSDEVLDPPLEAAEKRITEWEDADGEPARVRALERLDQHLARNAGDDDLYIKVVPRLPRPLVEAYIDQLDEAFVVLLRTYDGYISGNLPFAYCDDVARFYVRVFRATESVELQRLTLARLIEMGASHNRWRVGELTGALLSEIRDVSQAMVVAEVIDADSFHAAWFWDPWIKDRQIMRPIAEAFRRAVHE